MLLLENLRLEIAPADSCPSLPSPTIYSFIYYSSSNVYSSVQSNVIPWDTFEMLPCDEEIMKKAI